MSTKRAKPRKKSKRKQPDLPEITGPGVAAVQIDEIDNLAEEYVDVRDRRMALTKEEVPAKAALKAAMDKHSLKVYEYDSVIVEIEPGEDTVKVRKAKKATAEDDDDDQE